MTAVTDMQLPEIDFRSPEFGPDAYHGLLDQARAQGWLARSRLAYIVLDRQSGDFFLRARQTANPGREIAEFFGITSGPLYEHIDANILNLTGDRHRRLRALVAPVFTPRAAERWRPVMREFLTQTWAGLDGATSTEFMATVAEPYPSRTIAAVLGAPDSDAPELHRWSSIVERQFDIAALSTQLAEIEQAVAEVHEYVSALLEQRRKRPADDLITTLLAAETAGDKLSHDECVNLVVNVLAGGIDTTQSQLAHALRLFACHQDQWARLASESGLVPAAVQEVLRFEPATPFTARICRADIEHRGVLFPAGTIVAVCAERANREQDGGETFDITAARDGRLLTFSVGTHYCLGANLATAELEEALAFLAPRMPALALDGPPRLGGVEGIYGTESLPLRWSQVSENGEGMTY